MRSLIRIELLLSVLISSLAFGQTGAKASSAKEANQKRSHQDEAAKTDFRVAHLNLEFVAPGKEPTIKTVLGARRNSLDEPAQGPQSFEVLTNGHVLINDPLWSRIAVFEGDGDKLSLKDSIPTPASADRIGFDSKGILRFRPSHGGDFQPMPQSEWITRNKSSFPMRDSSGAPIKLNTHQGEIRGVNGIEKAITFNVSEFAWPLLSLRRLPSDDDAVYVLGELKESSNPVKIRQIVQKFSRESVAVCKIEIPPTSPYIRPLDEFRVSKGQLYQMTASDETISLKRWDLNNCK